MGRENSKYPILDMVGKVKLEIDEEGEIVGIVEGTYPVDEIEDDMPYRGSVMCNNQYGEVIEVGVDMDFETLCLE